mgnify:CR=1 FL=1
MTTAIPEKTFKEFDTCISISRNPCKCVVIKQEGNKVLVIDDPTLKDKNGNAIPTWYPLEKLRIAEENER